MCIWRENKNRIGNYIKAFPPGFTPMQNLPQIDTKTFVAAPIATRDRERFIDMLMLQGKPYDNKEHVDRNFKMAGRYKLVVKPKKEVK